MPVLLLPPTDSKPHGGGEVAAPTTVRVFRTLTETNEKRQRLLRKEDHMNQIEKRLQDINALGIEKAACIERLIAENGEILSTAQELAGIGQSILLHSKNVDKLMKVEQSKIEVTTSTRVQELRITLVETRKTSKRQKFVHMKEEKREGEDGEEFEVKEIYGFGDDSTCAICTNKLNGPCKSCDTICKVEKGECSHSFHVHCRSSLQCGVAKDTPQVCPVDGKPWVDTSPGSL